MLRILGWIALGVAALAITGVIATMSYRSLVQHRRATALVIQSPRGISESRYVTLGGVEQWVQIRGEDTANPVMLIVHGGPGMSYVPFTFFFREWEKHFTVVIWDHRGVGRTYRKNGTTGRASITFDRIADDGVELTTYLRERLHKEKVVLLGHSVGSVIGVLMAKRAPELFTAYIGTDQIADMEPNERVSYDMLIERAHAHGDTTVARQVGPPPYANVDAWFKKQQLISASDPTAPSYEQTLFKYIFTAPGYSVRDLAALGQGLKFSAGAMLHEMMTLDLRARGLDFELPVFIIEGENDVIDPTSLAVRYFGEIRAPKKELVVIRGAGHNSIFIRNTEFLSRVREFLQ